MGTRALGLVVLISLLPMVGCGTVANVVRSGPDEGGPSPFGGVRQDLWCMSKAVNGEIGLRVNTDSEMQHYSQLALWLFCTVDLPFSFVGDIVTWPYTATYASINEPIPVPPLLPQAAVAGAPQPAMPEALPEPRKLP